MVADFKLFPFQEEAVESLRTAALNWMAFAALEGPPKYGSAPIPFLGQLRAVTGSGKTPILAKVIGELGPSVVLWTSRSSAVIEQTFNNLRGKYAPLLPPGTKVIRDNPAQSEWRALIDSEDGITIWLLTVASWNEAESSAGQGSPDARLNLHRVHPDWAGETSPWDQLRNDLRRTFWVVSDESHNQSTSQLDQLADLRPKGFFMASATPVANERFMKWTDALEAGDPEWLALSRAGIVRVRTRDVVEAELLKTTVELVDYQSGTEESLDGVLATLERLDQAVDDEDASVHPRAIYVVEKSNPPRGSTSDPPPVSIWRYLRLQGVPADEIAIYTDTRVLPDGAEKVASLSALHDRYRHIIFNQTLQEGWDDPEAYVCYFDGLTNSYVRIKQIVGRILRQPAARHYEDETLNTATIILNVPASSYDTVVAELRAEMRLYAPEDDPDVPVIKVKTRKEPLDPISIKDSLRGTLVLPNRTLKAPTMHSVENWIKARGSLWDEDMLDAPGRGRRVVMSLKHEQQEQEEYLDVVRSARTQNGTFLRRYIQHRNRSCLNAIHPDAFSGPGYLQYSCLGSTAQSELKVLGDRVVEAYEAGVEYQDDPDPDTSTFLVGDYRPRGKEMMAFSNAAHPEYSTMDMNRDEREFARALDSFNVGVWARNPSTSVQGFSIPLPAKVEDSSRFYPDFLWWVTEDFCWALDTTGRHLLNAKVRGKLIALDHPHVALIVRGQVDLQSNTYSSKTGWTLVRAKPHVTATSEPFDDLPSLLGALAGPALVASGKDHA
jgi:type III restriction enzyme